jgi:polysaccharide transporter, PST family
VSALLRIGRLAINLVLMSFLGRYLGQGGFGQLMVAMSIVAVLLCVSELGFNRITVREIVRDQASQWQTLGSTFWSRILIGAVLYLGLIVYVLLAKPEYGTLLLIYGVLLLTHAGSEAMSWFEARQNVERVSLCQFAGFLVSAAFIGIGIAVKAPVAYFAVTYVIECWTVLACILVLLHRRGGRIHSWRWSWMRASALLRESWFELASQLALLLLFRLDTIMVEMMRGKDEAGIYSAAVRVSEVMYFIPVALASVSLPALMELRGRDAQAYQRRFADYFSLSLLVAVVCAAGIAFAAPLVISVLFGKDFTASSHILVIHAWSFIPYAIGVARTQYLTAEGRLWVNLPSVLLALIINVGLNLAWIPQHGGVGAAWATLIAYVVAWVASSFALPAARDVAKLLAQSIPNMPSALLQVWQRARPGHPF